MNMDQIEVDIPSETQRLLHPALHDREIRAASQNESTQHVSQPFDLQTENTFEITEDAFNYAMVGGRWAYLVLLGSFLCVATIDALCFSFGIQLTQIIIHDPYSFSSSNETHYLAFLMLPGSLFTGMNLIASPIAGALVNRFDYRPVSLVSITITTVLVLICSTTRKYGLFSLLYGLMGGLTCGLTYFSALTVVGQWFETHRALAVGLTLCGGGLGTCVMALIIPPTVERFTWHGALVLLAAVICQTALGASFFRPAEVHQAIKNAQNLEKLMTAKLRAKRVADKLKEKRDRIEKKSSKRGISIVGGTIMARIIEEKSRQRSSSTGSLDGMVITRDNELIALPNASHYEIARFAAAVYTSSLQRPDTEASAPSLPESRPSDRQQFYPRPSDKLHSTPRPLLTLPPHEFTKSAVIHIAEVIVRKLETQTGLLLDHRPGLKSHERHLGNITSSSDCLSMVRAFYGVTTADVVSPRGETPAGACIEPSQGIGRHGNSQVYLSRPTSCYSLDWGGIDLAIAKVLDLFDLDTNIKVRIKSEVKHKLRHSSRLAQQMFSTAPALSRTRLPNSDGNWKYSSRTESSIGSVVGLSQPKTSLKATNAQETGRVQTSTSVNRLDKLRTPPKGNSFSTLQELVIFLCAFMDIQILTNASFLLLLSACTLHTLAFYAPYHFLPLFLELGALETSRACHFGETELSRAPPIVSPTHILLAIGVAHLFGRLLATAYIEKVLAGPAESKKLSCIRLSDPTLLNILSLMLGGVSVICIPLIVSESCPHRYASFPLEGSSTNQSQAIVPSYNSYRVIAVYGATIVHTMASAFAISLRSVIAVELVGVRRLVPAFAYLLICQGVGAICGPPFIAFFCEAFSGVQVSAGPLNTMSYVSASSGNALDPAFYICAILFLLAVCLFAPIRRRTSIGGSRVVAFHEENLSASSVLCRPCDPFQSPVA